MLQTKVSADRQLANSWPSVGNLSVTCLIHSVCADFAPQKLPFVGKSEEQFPKDTVGRPTVGRQTASSRPSVGNLSVTCRQCVGKSCAEMIANSYLVIKVETGKIH